MKNQRHTLHFSLLYALCILFLFPVVWNSTGHPDRGPLWYSIMVRFSGPVLIYLGLVLQRTVKPVPAARKIVGIVIFLIGFGWLFSVMMAQTHYLL
jgi:hypothetical protein